MAFNLFSGTGPVEPIDLDRRLPPIDRSAQRAPDRYIADEPLRQAVDVAVYLGMPLLLTGEPGTGKTQLAYRVAAEFGLGEPLVFETKSSSIAQDLFYGFDAVRRFALAQTMAGMSSAEREAALDPRRFVRFQALGLAILRAHDGSRLGTWLTDDAIASLGPPTRSVVLIDEIDKAPRDFPNDLLNEIDRRRFCVSEIGDGFLQAPAARAPIVLITSNSEKQLPDAFLRRCVYHHIEPPDAARLAEIVCGRLPLFGPGQPLLADAIAFFESVRGDSAGMTKKPSTAELLNWLDVLQGMGADRSRSLRDQLPLARSSVRALAKTEDDLLTVQALLDALEKSPGD